MKTHYWITASLPALAVTAVLSTACTPNTRDDSAPHASPQPPPEIGEELIRARKEIAVLKEEKIRLKKALKKSLERYQELKLKFLDRTALAYQREAEKERAIQAVVQAKARLRSRQSKADIVANLAEIKLALLRAAKEGSGPEGGQILDQVRNLLDMVEQAVNENNLEGASYLMNQARELMSRVWNETTDTTDHNQVEVLFPVAFSLTVQQKGNVRMEPNLRSKVLFQLASGKDVLVLGRRGNWLRVRTPDNHIGWMYFKLLDPPD